MSAGTTRTIDELPARAGLDPAEGVQVVAADRLPAVAFDPSFPLLVLSGGSDHDPTLPGRHARHGPRAVLSALYPPSHELQRLADDATVALETLDDAALAADDWLVPPLGPIDNLASPHGMAAISARLRAPDGCPWDRKQTHLSLRPY